MDKQIQCKECDCYNGCKAMFCLRCGASLYDSDFLAEQRLKDYGVRA